jgi:hypothetical protein
MSRRGSGAIVALWTVSGIVAVMAAGCQKTFPTAPEPGVGRGIVIYEHANYRGDSALVEQDVKNLSDYKGPCVETSYSGQPGAASTDTYSWKNCVSSLRVAEGWKAVLYTNTNFGGDHIEVSADVSNLQLVPGKCDHDGLNDCIESIRVMPR